MSIRKAFVRVFNVVFLAGAAFATYKLATEPILDVKVSLGNPTAILDGILFPDSTDTSNLDEKSSMLTAVSRKDMNDAFDGLNLTANVNIPIEAAYNFQDATILPTVLGEQMNYFVDSTVDTFTEGFVKLLDIQIDSIVKDTLVSTLNDAVYSNVAKQSTDERGGTSEQEKEAFATGVAKARVPGVGEDIATFVIQTMKTPEADLSTSEKTAAIQGKVKTSIIAVLGAMADSEAADGNGILAGYEHFTSDDLATEIDNAYEDNDEVAKAFTTVDTVGEVPTTKDWLDEGYVLVTNGGTPVVYTFVWNETQYDLTSTAMTTEEFQAMVEHAGFLSGAKQLMKGITDGVADGLSTFLVDGRYEYYAQALPVVVGMVGITRLEVDTTSTMTIKEYYQDENWAFDGLKVYGYVGEEEDALKFSIPKYLYSVTPSVAIPAELSGNSMNLTITLNDGNTEGSPSVENFEVTDLSYSSTARTGQFPAVEEFNGAQLFKTATKMIVSGMVVPMLGMVTELPTDMLELGGFGGYAVLALVALAALPWLLFALITLIRTIRPKKCWTKVWVVFFFAFLELILGVVLTKGLAIALPSVKPILTDLVAQSSELGMLGGLIGGLDLHIQFGCYWASLVYVAMIPLTIVYMIFAHGVKKDFKAWKREKKAAKKAAKEAKKAA